MKTFFMKLRYFSATLCDYKLILLGKFNFLFGNRSLFDLKISILVPVLGTLESFFLSITGTENFLIFTFQLSY